MCWCANCQHFVPDKIGWGTGVGNCQKYEEFKEQEASEEQLKIAFRKLGNELFWGGLGGLPRHCSKYEEKSMKVNETKTKNKQWLQILPAAGKNVPLIDPAILLPHQKQLLWNGIKRDNPSLAEMLKTDETIALLKTTFDAKIMFTEEEAIGYMTEVHDA